MFSIGVLEIDVGPHVGRVLAAKLEPDAREGARRRPLDRLAGRDRAGEADLIDRAGGDQLRRVVMRQRQRAEQAFRQAGFVHRLLEAVADQQRLRGVLQEHGVAGHQRRHDRIDRRQIRIVPRRDGEHDADRLARDVALEAGLRLRNDVGAARSRPARSSRARAPRSRSARRRRSGSGGPSARRARARSRRASPAWRRRRLRQGSCRALRHGHALPFGLRRAGGRDRCPNLGARTSAGRRTTSRPSTGEACRRYHVPFSTFRTRASVPSP